MVTYEPHYLLQMIGTLGTNTGEEWSCGIRLGSENWAGFNEVDYRNGLGQTAPAEWFARPTSKISNNCRLTSVKFNFIGVNGRYQDTGNSFEYIYPAPIAGGGGSSALSYQDTVVLSWHTNARTRGLASRGRIYSPAPVVVPSSNTGLFPIADALGMATSAALFLNTLDVGWGVEGSFLRPGIFSPVNGSWNQIDEVTVDNRVDTQRRRSRSLVPLHAAADVLY